MPPLRAAFEKLRPEAVSSSLSPKPRTPTPCSHSLHTFRKHVPGGLTHTVPSWWGKVKKHVILKKGFYYFVQKAQRPKVKGGERERWDGRIFYREQTNAHSPWALSRCRCCSSALPMASHEVHPRTQPHEVGTAVALILRHKK